MDRPQPQQLGVDRLDLAQLHRAGDGGSRRFAVDDHRTYSRSGQAFAMGETSSGVPNDVGVRAAPEVRPDAAAAPRPA